MGTNIKISTYRIAAELFGEGEYRVVNGCLLGEPELVWRQVNNINNAQFHFRDECMKEAVAFLESELRWLYGKEICVSMPYGARWIRATLKSASFFAKLMNLAEELGGQDFMIACDECQELVVMFHKEHYDYFCKTYSSALLRDFQK